MITLRPYQDKFVSDIRAAFRQGIKRVLGVSPTGSGKSACLATVAKGAVSKGNRITIIAPRSEILSQLSDTLSGEGVDHGVIQSGYPMRLHMPVQLASAWTLAKRLGAIPKPDVILVDECFVAGTVVGGVAIEKLKVGMPVTAWDESKKSATVDHVSWLMKSRPKGLMTICFSNGKKITCTPSHPIFTRYGFVPSGMLTKFDMVLSITPYELQNMRRVCETNLVRLQGVQIGALQEKYDGGFEEAWRTTNQVSKNKWDARSESEGSCFNEVEGDGVEAAGSGWKWASASSGADNAGVRSWVGYGSCDTNQRMEVRESRSELLQAGYCEQRFDGWGGGGWNVSRFAIEKISGREEGGILSWVGVDNIEIHKQTSDGTFGGMCPDGFVYNIETRKTHTYVANGIAVHNCHRCASDTYHQIVAAYSSAHILGVTATPERLDGKGLGDYFQTMVRGPEVSWLIENGYLARPVYYAPSTVDLSGVHVRMGDFAKNEIAGIMEKPSIIGDAVKHYRRYASGRTAIAFCVNIKHAEAVAASFRAAGVSSEIIEGRMSDLDRKRIVGRLSSGETKVMVSVDLVSEGFDLPAVGAAILLRPTASLGLYLQQVGRCLRPKKDGGDAVILDHVGNCVRHGLAEEQREWSLDGKAAAKRKREVSLETRTCENCFAVFVGTVCPQCQTERESKVREIEQKEGELARLDAEAMLAARSRVYEESKCRTFNDFRELGKRRGHKPGWAWHRWNASKWNLKGRHEPGVHSGGVS